MNATPNANSLAAAFAHAAARSTLHQPVPAVETIPPVQRDECQTLLTPDELLLTVLRRNLSPADKIMARRTLLRAVPWEQALS
jgi:hypothetical protein